MSSEHNLMSHFKIDHYNLKNNLNVWPIEIKGPEEDDENLM